MKQITEIHCKIKVGKEYYRSSVRIGILLNSKHSIKKKQKQIREIIEQTMGIMIDRVVDDIQVEITGKDETEVMGEEVEKELTKSAN